MDSQSQAKRGDSKKNQIKTGTDSTVWKSPDDKPKSSDGTNAAQTKSVFPHSLSQ